MKKSIRLLLLALSISLILSFTVGCSSKKSESRYDTAPAEENSTDDYMPNSVSVQDSSKTESNLLEPEKVITTISLSFETTEFEETNKKLNELIKKHKAYVENSNISYNHYYNNKSYRYGEFVIRVPKENVSSFKTDLNGIGNMLSENTNKQDVTKQYKDTESRLTVVTVKEERILALLEKAEKIEDIIALENQLNEVIYEKENLKTSLIDIDDKVDFSTLHINIQEVDRLTNSETVETTFGTRIKNAINDSFFGFKSSFENFVIWFIYSLPFIIVFGILIYIAFKIGKKFIYHRKNKS